MNVESESVEKLVELLRTGDRRAFEKLFFLFHSSILDYCTHMLSDPDAARDAAQESFVKAWRDAGALRDVRKFRPWLFGIARHQTLMMLRTRKNERHQPFDDEIWMDETPLDIAVKNQLQEIVRKAVDALTPGFRETIVLRDFHHLSYAEIADATMSTESAVKSRLYKARKALIGKLAPLLDRED